MKKIVFGVLVAVVLAVAGAFFYVTNINWNEHKDKIAQQFYNMTGKEIELNGKLNFKIFPSPYLSVFDVKIYNTSRRDEKPLVEAKHVTADLSLPLLLRQEFNITKMVLEDALINLDWDDENLNWQSDLSPDQRQMIEDSKMVLNSVSLRNAEVNIEASRSGKKWVLTNLNGEVSAQSVFGPFRIEGNYLNGSSTEGFAITLGKFSDSFATTLNGVVSHPKSESYVRFDGNFHLKNKMINGNVIVESQRLSDFVNANNDQFKLSSEYNFPVALAFDLALSDQNLAMSNVVVKYGETQGSGELQLPLQEGERPEVTLDFNFSNLELDPVVKFVQDFFEKYRNNPYQPKTDFDFFVNLKAVRTSYEGQNFKNLQTSFSFDEDTFLLNNFNIVLPGETQLQAKGRLYPVEDEVYYQADVSLNTNDLMRTLQWLKIEPKATATSIYKKMNGNAKIAGNFEKLQISPYKFTLDKSTFSGEAGIVFGPRKDIMLIVKADTINFDNYISSLPDEEKKKSWLDRMRYRFEKLGVLNEFDMVLDAKADLVIYESMPFERVDFKGNVLNGVMDVEYCKIDKVANASVDVFGKLRGLGREIRFEPLQYDLKTDDLSSTINKLELRVPDFDYKKFSSFSTKGILNGSDENFTIDTTFDWGQLKAAYKGQVSNRNDLTNYKGSLELKHPDFAALLAGLKSSYEPSVQSLGVFQGKADVNGSVAAFSLNNLEMNIGYTNISGNFEYDSGEKRPNINTQLKINKFEVDKFLPKKQGNIVAPAEESVKYSFLKRPVLSKEKFDYSPYAYVDMLGEFDIGELSYQKDVFKNATFRIEASERIADLKDFSAEYRHAPLKGALTLRMTETPKIQGQGFIQGANINDFAIGGEIYGLKDGTFSARFDFDTSADSEQSFVSDLKGKAEFEAENTYVRGLNLLEIYHDLLERETSEGLVDFVKKNIGSGQTLFNKVSGRVVVENKQYSLADVSMTAPNALVKVYGEGSFVDWLMNATFNVKYPLSPILPEYSFSLRTSMDNPTTDVDVSLLFNLYQSRAKQREEQLSMQREAERKYWDDQIKAQQKISSDLVSSTRKRVENNLSEKISSAFSSESISQYMAIKQDINQVLANVLDSTNGIDLDEVDDEMLQKLKDANNHALSEIEMLEKKIPEIYFDDLQKENENLVHKIVEAHNKLKKTIFTYNTQIDKYSERLSNIVTDYDLDKDEAFQKAKQAVDDAIQKLEYLVQVVGESHPFRVEGATAEDYHDYNRDLDEVYQIVQRGNAEIFSAAKKLDERMMPKISDLEVAYNKEIEDKNNLRRIKENTGLISVKKTGKTVTVVRDLNEIKSAEREISDKKVKVLDFSKKKVEVSSEEKKPTENVIKKARTIR